MSDILLCLDRNIFKQVAELKSHGKHKAYACDICAESSPEASENVYHIDPVSAVGIHSEIVGMENEVEKYSEGYDRIHKHHGLYPMLEIGLDLTRKGEEKSVKRAYKVADRLAGM